VVLFWANPKIPDSVACTHSLKIDADWLAAGRCFSSVQYKAPIGEPHLTSELPAQMDAGLYLIFPVGAVSY
jgi:hypothetical protein